MKYTIPLHSFVDLITNSSSEIYVQATEKTRQTVKDIINAMLKHANSDKTCDDLFDIKLVIPAGTYNRLYGELPELGEELKEPVDAESVGGARLVEYAGSHDNGLNIELDIKCKIDDPNLKLIARRLESIGGSYDTQECYN